MAHKVLATELAQSVFAEPARHRKWRDKSSRDLFCGLTKQLKLDSCCFNGALVTRRSELVED